MARHPTRHSREGARHSREGARHSREGARHSREGARHSREGARHSREGARHSREGARHSREGGNLWALASDAGIPGGTVDFEIVSKSYKSTVRGNADARDPPDQESPRPSPTCIKFSKPPVAAKLIGARITT